MKNAWPKQKNRDTFYGNPRGKNGEASEKWKAANLTVIKPPFKMYYAGQLVTKITVHKKCADSLLRVLNAIWVAAGKSQDVIHKWGMDLYAGCFNFRLSRNSDNISSHAYACAVDFDAVNKPNGQSSKRFCKEVIAAFEAESWVNLKNDPMHFQAAIP
jgi:hypothetical protein